MPIIFERPEVNDIDDVYDHVVAARMKQGNNRWTAGADCEELYDEDDFNMEHHICFDDDDGQSGHVGFSVPTAEQLRNELPIDRRSTKERASIMVRKWTNYFTTDPRGRFLALVMSALFLSACVICFVTVGVSYHKNDSSATEPLMIKNPLYASYPVFSTPKTNGRNSDYGEAAIYLIENNISTIEDLSSTSTYQYQAVNWLVNIDEANLVVPTYQSVHQELGYMYMVRYVFALLYFTLNGPGWRSRINFLSADHVCSWNEQQLPVSDHYELMPGLYTDFVLQWGVNCTGSVPTTLSLDDNNLLGAIPRELGQVTTLKKVNFYKNSLTGTVPSSLCQLTELVELNIGSNKLGNTIPTCVGDYQHLIYINLSRNRFTGSLPTQLGSLSGSLEHLIIGNNGFTGQPIESIFNKLTNLRSLQASNNGLEGLVDNKFLARSLNLLKIDLSNNRLTTKNYPFQLPTHLLNGLPQLTTLDLSKNRLRASFPPDIPYNSKLSYLSFYDNMLTGNITNRIENLNGLVHLDLSNNQFLGTIPTEIGSMFNLRFLNLAQNELLDDAPIPSTLVNLVNLDFLSLRGTNRIGRMPVRINKLRNLKYLDFSHNKITGALPLSYYLLSSLEVMMLNSNNVSGVIPETIGYWSNLHAAFFDGMDLIGTLDPLCPFITTVKHEVIYADCGGNKPKVICSCCQCCRPSKDSMDGCSRDKVDELDSVFEYSYQLSEYSVPVSNALDPDFQSQLCQKEGICN